MMRRTKKTKLPEFLRPYFWDIDFSKLEPKKSPKYVIERILEFGDERAVRWVLMNYREPVIRDVVKKSRAISKKTTNFWALFYNIPLSQTVCYKKGFPNPPVRTWPY